VAGGARLIDVRSEDEYRDKHIEGAENEPVDTIGEREHGPKDAVLVVYCKSGGRAARAAAALRAKGYARVYELGAMSNWDK
jgi:phage shock protein E